MMANYYWIKLYYDLLDDRKVGQLPDSLKWRFIECLLFAGEQHENGYLPSIEDMAWRLGRMMPEALTNDLSHLARAGLLELKDHGNGERWYVTEFAKRQQARSRADIQASYRERKRQADMTNSLPVRYQPVTDGNTDIDIDKNRIDIDKSGRPPMHEHIPEPIIAIRTAILTQVKTRMTSKNETEFNDTAYAVFGMDATPEEIKGFDGWWSKHGYYDGLPARQSFEDEYANYQRSLNGHVDEMVPGVDFKVFDEVDE